MPPPTPRYTSSGTAQPICGTCEILASYRTGTAQDEDWLCENEEDPGYLADDEDNADRERQRDVEYLGNQTWKGGFGGFFWKLICDAMDEQIFRW